LNSRAIGFNPQSTRHERLKETKMAANPDHVPGPSTVGMHFVPEYDSLIFSQPARLTFSAHLTAPEVVGEEKRSVVSLSAVLDKSGSMSKDLYLVKRTCDFMLQQLSKNDKLGVIQYDSEVDEVNFPMLPDLSLACWTSHTELSIEFWPLID
jgi:hypothetical protein